MPRPRFILTGDILVKKLITDQALLSRHGRLYEMLVTGFGDGLSRQSGIWNNTPRYVLDFSPSTRRSDPRRARGSGGRQAFACDG
jgi:hypothetical protein